MSIAPVPPSRLDRVGHHLLKVAGQTALICGLWFGLIRFPEPPTAGLDSSWRMVLGYATNHGLQYGHDVVFTYGPLGYLMAATNLGEHFYQHLAWQLGINLIFAVAIYLLGRTLNGWKQVVFYCFFFAYGTAYLDSAHMIVIVVLGLSLLRESVVRHRWLMASIAALLAIIALVKFTNLVLASFALLSVMGLFLWRRQWLNAATLASAFAVTFLGVWAALGQHLSNLPAYFSTSLEISRGYNEAMGVEESTAMLVVGLITAVTLGAYFLCTLYRRTDQAKAVAVVLIAAAASYINWKHGFVRADGHVSAHFYLSLFFVCSFGAALQDNENLRRCKGVMLAVCAAFCLVGIWLNSPPWITNLPAFYNLRVMENLNMLSVVQDLNRNGRDQFQAISKGQLLPATKLMIGDKPVDIFGSEQAYAFFNGLNYRPRPVFQSYSAYTKPLAELNARFMASDRAPEFVMTKMHTIDNRLPNIDDSLALRYVMHHYTFAMEEGGFLVWKRNPPKPGLDDRTLILEKSIGFGDLLPVPAAGDDEPIWCEIQIKPSLLGRLRSFFYKPVQPLLAVADGDNFKTSYRLVRGMGEAGFLLHPYLTSNYAVSKYAEGGPAPRLQQFGVSIAPSHRKYFDRRVVVRLYRLPPFPRAADPALKIPEVRFRVFSQPPTSVSALFPPSVIPEDGKEVLLAHPPSELEFRVLPKVKHISGHFGFVANAYTNNHTTDGAEFIAEWIDGTGNVSRMFYRHLRPLEYPQDRGEQSFDFVPPPGGGRLKLRITPGPNGNIAFDWAYWTGVKFTE